MHRFGSPIAGAANRRHGSHLILRDRPKRSGIFDRDCRSPSRWGAEQISCTGQTSLAGCQPRIINSRCVKDDGSKTIKTKEEIWQCSAIIPDRLRSLRNTLGSRAVGGFAARPYRLCLFWAASALPVRLLLAPIQVLLAPDMTALGRRHCDSAGCLRPRLSLRRADRRPERSTRAVARRWRDQSLRAEP